MTNTMAQFRFKSAESEVPTNPNNLTGTIPTEFGNLSQLKAL